MRMPKWVAIGYKLLKVVERPGLMLKKEIEGQLLYSRCLVQVEKGISAYEQVNVLMHELGHAQFKIAGMDHTFHKRLREEQIVECLTNGWLDALSRNPKLLEWVYHTIKEHRNVRRHRIGR